MNVKDLRKAHVARVLEMNAKKETKTMQGKMVPVPPPIVIAPDEDGNLPSGASVSDDDMVANVAALVETVAEMVQQITPPDDTRLQAMEKTVGDIASKVNQMWSTFNTPITPTLQKT